MNPLLVAQQPTRLLERRRLGPRKKFSSWVETTLQPVVLPTNGLQYQLCGSHGLVHVYPNLVPMEHCQRIKDELLGFRHQIGPDEYTAFRKHRVQSQWEPRIQFMLHEKATDPIHNRAQPGYSYAKNVVMKGLPLEQFPAAKALSSYLEDITRPGHVENNDNGYWNIGVHAIFYRGGSDAMGFHADDDQEESLILSVILMQENHRIVTFRPKGKGYLVEYQLHLVAGDAYSMDGVMQQDYLHGVPAQTLPAVDVNTSHQAPDKRRLVLIFRRGLYKEFQSASGTPCTALDFAPMPRPKPYTFGPIPGLVIGDLTTRQQLVELGAHKLRERGVSGNQAVGCDAIIVSGKRNQQFSADCFVGLVYAATSKEGALSLMKSQKDGRLVRVFRSSNYKSEFRALAKKGGPSLYRYDGLYTIQGIKYIKKAKVFQFMMAQVESRRTRSMFKSFGKDDYNK